MRDLATRALEMREEGMRRTVLEKNGAQQITVVTDGQGTQVIDENGSVLTTYGDDRHDEAVANYVRQGWVIIENTRD
jgi:hypothetical protein